jgi:molybdenum cofactor synthesis domain-containing protein
VNPLRIAVVTISDGVAAGSRTDTSGPAIEAWAAGRGYEVVHRIVAADDTHAIVNALIHCCDTIHADVVLTTGGTGLTARDVTPEATRAVMQREAPGIAEAIRAAGARNTAAAWISRGLAGTRGASLIVNLPGSIGGVNDGLNVIATFVDHAVQLLRGTETAQHPANG